MLQIYTSFLIIAYWGIVIKVMFQNGARTFRPKHFGLGRFGLDISATDVSATENAEGGRFGHNHKFLVWDVCMYKCVIHFIIF